MAYFGYAGFSHYKSRNKWYAVPVYTRLGYDL